MNNEQLKQYLNLAECLGIPFDTLINNKCKNPIDSLDDENIKEKEEKNMND